MEKTYLVWDATCYSEKERIILTSEEQFAVLKMLEDIGIIGYENCKDIEPYHIKDYL